MSFGAGNFQDNCIVGNPLIIQNQVPHHWRLIL